MSNRQIAVCPSCSATSPGYNRLRGGSAAPVPRQRLLHPGDRRLQRPAQQQRQGPEVYRFRAQIQREEPTAPTATAYATLPPAPTPPGGGLTTRTPGPYPISTPYVTSSPSPTPELIGTPRFAWTGPGLTRAGIGLRIPDRRTRRRRLDEMSKKDPNLRVGVVEDGVAAFHNPKLLSLAGGSCATRSTPTGRFW